MQPHSRNSAAVDPSQHHRLLTTLRDPQQAPALDLILCYHERWEIERCIDEIKAPLRRCDQPLRSKDPHLVYQELSGLLFAHYAVRWWMAEAAAQAHLDPDRLSFTHAVPQLDLCSIAFSLLAREDVAPLQQRLLTDRREPSALLPPRRLRFFPRLLKPAFPSFPRKQLWHEGVHFTHTAFQQLLLSMALTARSIPASTDTISQCIIDASSYP